MSKTVELQIEKSRNLIEGLRKHVNAQGGGVTSEEIDSMEQTLKELVMLNEEVDRLRDELAPKVRQLNKAFANLKVAHVSTKKVLKGYYPQEAWAEYGIPDKR
mgnify:CR=1 FL=1